MCFYTLLMHVGSREHISSRFSSNSEALASELLGNHEEMYDTDES